MTDKSGNVGAQSINADELTPEFLKRWHEIQKRPMSEGLKQVLLKQLINKQKGIG